MKMKKIISGFLILLAFCSCQDDVKFNDPSLQARKDNSFWKAVNYKATKNASGKLTIEGYTQNETVSLQTSTANVGTFVFGTTNLINKAFYTINNSIPSKYETAIVPGTVNKIVLLASGSGYTTADGLTVTGGSGTGLRVNVTANTSGVVTLIEIFSPGNNYKAGDLITIVGGAQNAKFSVQNVAKSSGQIVITAYDGATVSGTFEFNAPLITGNTTDPKLVSFQEGAFLKLPVQTVP